MVDRAGNTVEVQSLLRVPGQPAMQVFVVRAPGGQLLGRFDGDGKGAGLLTVAEVAATGVDLGSLR